AVQSTVWDARRLAAVLGRRSRSLAVDPGGDALDDVELLARPHEPESPSLLGQRLAGAHLGQPVLKLALLGLQSLHVGCPACEVVLRLDVAAQRAGVKEADEHDRGQPDPTHHVARARWRLA